MTISAAAADEDFAYGDALDVHAEDAATDLRGLHGVGGELDAARLASTANQYLGLDHDSTCPSVEESLGRSPHFLRRVGNFPGRDG